MNIDAIADSIKAQVDRCRAANKYDEQGILEMPFTCYCCNARRFDFYMSTGDGLPICRHCFLDCDDKLEEIINAI